MSAAENVTPDLLRRMPLPQHRDGDDKDGRGRVLVVAGSVEVPGAALLAGTAALRAGAGKLQIATCRSVALHLGLAVPESLVIALGETPAGGIDPGAATTLCERGNRCDAVLIGPGMADGPSVAALTAELLGGLAQPAVVLDAEALVGLAECRELVARRSGRVVITPHAGEMAKLLGIPRDEVLADPLAAARRAAALLRCVVAMKGGCTYVVSPDGTAWACSQGNVGLATSGSGDTLAGIILGLLARGAAPVCATLWGVFLHGEAGQRLARAKGPVGFLARELLAEIPCILAGFPNGQD